MDRLELAERRYRQIVPPSGSAWHQFPLKAVEVWLKDDVCALAEDYSKRPAFKDMATWPLRLLVSGSGSPERALVEAIETGLVRSAGSLLEIAAIKGTDANMLALTQPRATVAERTVVLTNTSIARTHLQRAHVDTLAIEKVQVQQIANHFWTDLVCKEDYFQPTGGWMLPTPPPRQPAEFVVAFNPELHPIGDFVTRSMTQRIAGLVDVLVAFRGKCLHAVPKTRSGRRSHLKAEEQQWHELTANVAALDRACFTGQNACLRDSCIILTQVYAMFGRSPELAWLGLPPTLVKAGVMVLRHRLTHTRNPEMIDRIATSLGDLRHLYKEGYPEKSATEEAIASQGLVLIEATREAYWEAKRIEVPWRHFRILWKLLWELALKARLGAAVEECHLYPDAGARSKMATNVSRLTDRLPATLMQLIDSVHGARSYRLQLESSRIHLFPADGDHAEKRSPSGARS